MITINVSYHTTFDSLQKGAEQRAQNAIAQAALEIEAHAKSFAPVDTGFLRNSINADQVDKWEWDVISPAFYSVYQEFGTVKMAPHPFMTPAVEIVRPKFEKAMRSLL